MMLRRLGILNSFALRCVTKKDGYSVSTASLKEGPPQGTVSRIASSSGVRGNTLCQLRKPVNILNDVASGGIPTSYPIAWSRKACIPH